MLKITQLIIFLSFTSIAHGQQKILQRPKLVVGIVVDQMRWDYLYRYYERYGDDGFKRLMKEGYNCQSTMINYLPSFTAPGHASVYTGTVPAIHGVAANDWWESSKGKMTYCTADDDVQTVGGGTAKAGKMSPVNMYTTTITDELKIATQQGAKVFGIGLKDRGSILPAGHSADGAFWFDDSTGNFITSSYYMNELPDWVTKFNQRRWADTLIKETWELLYPLNTYVNSTDDNMPVEGLLKGETSPVFPHKVQKGSGYGALRYLPGGNTITLKAARACIKAEQLGKDDITDFLCITLSTTDYAGHNYGPDAVEMEDMFLRVDQDIASLLKYLDKYVGTGNYTLFLTADHGAAHNADYLKKLKIPAGSETQAQATGRLNEYLKVMVGEDSLITALYNYQVYFDKKRLTAKRINAADAKQHVKNWLKMQEGVAFVVDLDHLSDEVVPEPLRTMIINGYYEGRCGSLQIIMKPGWYSGHGKTGTTHGTWNPYDTHIPLLWYGSGINKGSSYLPVNITDIAPTLAALLKIQMPNGCTGTVIPGVLQ